MFQDDLFPSPPANLKSSSAMRQDSSGFESTSASRQDSVSNSLPVHVDTETSREDLLRKRIEFMGLKPEDSEEYKTMQEGKLVFFDNTRRTSTHYPQILGVIVFCSRCQPRCHCLLSSVSPQRSPTQTKPPATRTLIVPYHQLYQLFPISIIFFVSLLISISPQSIFFTNTTQSS